MIADHGLQPSELEPMRLGRILNYVEMLADLAKMRAKQQGK
ncbi:hypothetical protein ACVWXO_008379 [Bradyrhizobium sp. LM2.7]